MQQVGMHEHIRNNGPWLTKECQDICRQLKPSPDRQWRIKKQEDQVQDISCYENTYIYIDKLQANTSMAVFLLYVSKDIAHVFVVSSNV
jgi:hypothetical protein